MCEFDKNGVCRTLVCYSSEKCNSRDEKGNPIYCGYCEKCKSFKCNCSE